MRPQQASGQDTETSHACTQDRERVYLPFSHAESKAEARTVMMIPTVRGVGWVKSEVLV